MRHATSALERIAIGLASVALSVGLIALLSGFFAQRDQAGVGSGTPLAGARFPDLGHTHLRVGELRPPYNSDPPTSGAHIPAPVLHDQQVLSDDELLQALEVGDVVLAYGTPHAPQALRRLSDAVSGPFTSALGATGQAVILASRPGTRGVIGLAWTRMLRVSSAADPRLARFAQQWLGRGAP